MVGIQGGSGGAGFDYVQDPSPQDPEEGEEWYDTGSDRAFVFDGANWIEQTIGDHGQLSGIGTHDHHSPPTGTQPSAGSTAAWSNWGQLIGQHVYGPVDKVEYRMQNGFGSQTVNFSVTAIDGTTWSDSLSDSSGTWQYGTFDIGGAYIVEMSYGGGDQYSSETMRWKPLSFAGHSHSI
ncbi:hypothetical protein JCM30237_12420 [Halolamina litorea]|uniref:Uncharacterized protein n=1 Tax=Halolamina litorea TaxID=1515593 RepID=A0ABD6BMP3_9EURY|nr:hypothetical protein [Halolamina litorea]